jgi:hypothetical protein
MIKRIIIGIVAVIIGIGIAFFADTFFREQIQKVFLWSTSNRIKFTGKNFHLFNGNFYYLTFAIAFLLFSLGSLKQGLKRTIKSGILSILIFTLAVLLISSIDANMKIIECTACNDGIRALHWNEVNYDLILSTSILFSVIPNIVSLVKMLYLHN